MSPGTSSSLPEHQKLGSGNEPLQPSPSITIDLSHDAPKEPTLAEIGATSESKPISSVLGTRKKKKKQPVRGEPEAFTREEVQSLLALCNPRYPTGRRNAALIVMGWRCGLRCSEALDLMPSAVLSTGVVRVRNGKGGKSRQVALGPEAFAVLGRWMDVRKALPITKTTPLLCTLEGGAIDGSYVRRLMPRLGERAGIEGRSYFHRLRHTFASDLMDEGQPLSAIQAALGHDRLETTAVYIHGLNPKALTDMLSSRESDRGIL